MAVAITNADMCAMYDTVTGTAFGPIGAEEELLRFMHWLKNDARTYSDDELEHLFYNFQLGKEYGFEQ